MKKFLLLSLSTITWCANAQDDLLQMVSNEEDKAPKQVYATFKTVRIGNAQTIETVKAHHLDFRIAHRFGNIYDNTLPNPLNEMGQSFFGLENVSDVRFSLDYGIVEDLNVGLGWNKFNGLVDGTMKYRFLHQTSDFRVPVSMALYESVGYTHQTTEEIYAGTVKTGPTNEAHRFNYFTQLIVACKLNELISLEVLPSYLHRNFIKQRINPNNDAQDKNDLFSLGFGGRIKITKRMSFIGDYFYTFAPFYKNNEQAFNPLSLGIEIETGGHVFSLFFTNANAIIENNFIPYTSDSWLKGQVKFGFMISRTFAL